ncbi:hypothetical protein AGMMS4956_21390 [Bacteroidia bacterium]|nr:hypothetical protein AGMMS4956_21390 [Bacteroidia bacterium]
MLTKDISIREVQGILPEKKQRIRDFLQGAVYCWCNSNSQNDPFCVANLVGGNNYYWQETPLSDLFKHYKTLYSSNEKGFSMARLAVGSLLEEVLSKDKRLYAVEKRGERNFYRWIVEKVYKTQPEYWHSWAERLEEDYPKYFRDRDDDFEHSDYCEISVPFEIKGHKVAVDIVHEVSIDDRPTYGIRCVDTENPYKETEVAEWVKEHLAKYLDIDTTNDKWYGERYINYENGYANIKLFLDALIAAIEK